MLLFDTLKRISISLPRALSAVERRLWQTRLEWTWQLRAAALYRGWLTSI